MPRVTLREGDGAFGEELAGAGAGFADKTHGSPSSKLTSISTQLDGILNNLVTNRYSKAVQTKFTVYCHRPHLNF